MIFIRESTIQAQTDITKQPSLRESSSQSGGSTAEPHLLRLRIASIGGLRRCYLSFMRRGGLFLREAPAYAAGAQLLLILRLPRAERPRVLTARVAWICPPHNPAGMTPGCGLHFDESGVPIRKQIESLLATEAASDEAGCAL